MRIRRPIVRSFSSDHFDRAAAHVRAGGHAIVWETPKRALLVVPRIDPDDDEDLGLWAILDMGRDKYDDPARGAFRGLSTFRVPRDCHDLVRARCERDSVHAGSTRTIRLDCLACGACCVKNEVLLMAPDRARFRKAGRADLLEKPYSRRNKDGKLVLTLTRERRCKHLARDNKCGIYAIRPDACSMFPAGSECCIYSRSDEHGWGDSD